MKSCLFKDSSENSSKIFSCLAGGHIQVERVDNSYCDVGGSNSLFSEYFDTFGKFI